jgi:hypothetical protein
MAVFKNSGAELWFPSYVEGGISNLHDNIMYPFLSEDA